MALLISQVIRHAFKKTGAIDTLGEPDPHLTADALIDLNAMLQYFSAQKLFIPFITKENFDLVDGTYIYTIGTGGDFNTARPLEIKDAFIKDSDGNNYPLTIVSEKVFNEWNEGTTESRPDILFYNPEFPLGKIYLRDIPDDSTDDLYIDSIKRLASIAKNDLNGTILLPDEYEEVVIYNLAIRLGPEHGGVSDDVKRIADRSYRTVIGLNARNKTVDAVGIDAINGGGGRFFDIKTLKYK